MQTRSSVRLILIAGSVAIVAIVAWFGYALTRDEPPAEEVAATTRARHVERERDPHGTPPSDRQRTLEDDSFDDEEIYEPVPKHAPVDDEPEEVGDDGLTFAQRNDGLQMILAQSGSTEPDIDELSRAQRAQDIVRAEITPEYEGTEFVGLRIGALPPDQAGFLEQAGLTKGDLIIEINGRRADDPELGPEAMYMELSSSQRLDLLVVDGDGSAWRRSVE
ncbi:MAG: hypothetical protein AAF500_14845 [Myxococcota bacterium]